MKDIPTRVGGGSWIRTGSAWYNPIDDAMYAGELARPDESVYLGQRGKRYEGAIIGDLAESVQAKIVLEELLGLTRPLYTLDNIVRTIPAPELVKTVGVATKGTGQRNVGFLEESEITGSVPTPTTFNCHPNEYHIVVEDKGARQGAWDMLGNYIQDGAEEVVHMRNQDIAEAAYGATDYATGGEWDDVTTPPNSDHNPLTGIGVAYNTLAALGYPANFLAVYGSDWANFVTNTHIGVMLQSGALSLGGQGAQQQSAITLPGYPGVKVWVDFSLTAAHALLGNSRGIVLADGGTESVKYRHDRKRYTGFIIRQYLDVQLVDANCARDLTGIA